MVSYLGKYTDCKQRKISITGYFFTYPTLASESVLQFNRLLDNSLFFLPFVSTVGNLCVYLGSVPQSVSHLLMHVGTMLACRLAFERSFSMICNFRQLKLLKLTTKDTILYKIKCYKHICCGVLDSDMKVEEIVILFEHLFLFQGDFSPSEHE